MIEFLFWSSLFLLGYTYVGYPIVLWAWATIRPRDIRRAAHRPQVSIILAVHNEEPILRDKLENLLRLDYPRELLEILVVSDHSTDGTVSLAREYAGDGITVLELTERGGKHAAQSAGIVASKGEILVFTDAAAMLDRYALSVMMEYFADPEVGCVTSEDRVQSDADHSEGEGIYIRYLMYLRRLESLTGSVVGLSGSLFGARRELCNPWSIDRSSDFTMALRAVMRGLRAVNAVDCLHTYRSASDPELEFHRKVRTVLNGMLVFLDSLAMLNPFRYGFFALKLFSHKLCRWSVPLLLAVAFLTSAALLGHGAFYRTIFALQAIFYLLAFAGLLAPGLNRFRWIRIPFFFCLANAAIVGATYDLVVGRRSVVWNPTPRPIQRP